MLKIVHDTPITPRFPRMRMNIGPALSLDVGLDPCCEWSGGHADAVDVGVLKAARLLAEELRDLGERDMIGACTTVPLFMPKMKSTFSAPSFDYRIDSIKVFT